jgi:ArsR family transcriptional regulator, arsenate/arsenite/antimonite-responsive transcriptional repressor
MEKMAQAKEADCAWTVAALAALAHEHRLAAYRLLVEAGPSGIAAGEIAESLGLVASSLTFHIQALLRAGLVSQRRASRNVIYAADFTAMNSLIRFLVANCCGQEAEICVSACNPARPSKAQATLRAKRRSA